MQPTIGRIVIYNTTDYFRNSVQGNKAKQLPAIVTAVWGETCVNLKVITDGVNDIWVTSAQQGNEEGYWNWPERV